MCQRLFILFNVVGHVPTPEVITLVGLPPPSPATHALSVLTQHRHYTKPMCHHTLKGKVE